MRLNVTDKTATAWKNMFPIEYRIGINSGLILRQGINQKDIGEVFAAHGEKCSLFNRAKDMLDDFATKGEIDNIDHLEIEKVNRELTQLEFRAQIAWRFDEDKAFHNWWMDMPGCCCPQMDNKERLGVADSRIYNGGCPWHGWFDSSRTEI